jgi:hypothetical protein
MSAVYIGGESGQIQEPVDNLSADSIFPRRACLPAAPMTSFKCIGVTAIATFLAERSATFSTPGETIAHHDRAVALIVARFK